jgi:hypothetical protein
MRQAFNFSAQSISDIKQKQAKKILIDHLRTSAKNHHTRSSFYKFAKKVIHVQNLVRQK